MTVHRPTTGSKASAPLRRVSDGLLAAIALLLAACDGGSSSQPPAASAPAIQPKVSKPAQDPLAAMTRAVATSKAGAQVELTYEVRGKPAPGGTVDLKLLFMPTADAESLTAEIGVAAPLSATGELKPSFNDVKVGQMNEHGFTVRVPADTGAGIYLATTTVSLTRGGMTTTKSFAIPLVVART